MDHFTPCYEYFHYNNKNIINYVLYFENLQKEFNNLFNDIKLDIASGHFTCSDQHTVLGYCTPQYHRTPICAPTW